jgi:arylsulfatase A-like enzyme
MTDQQHTSTLGCYGNETIRTPNIDGLASDGVVFDRHYVTSPLCVPSRASLWSSQYPHTIGVMVNDDRRGVDFPAEIDTIGDIAKAAGYRCGYIGKWHIGNEQTPQHGFDDAWWTQLRGSYEQQLEEQGAVRFDDDLSDRLDQRGVVPFEQAHDTVVADRTIDFIDRHADEPFFAVCSMRAPHDPYIGPFDDLYDPGDVELPSTVLETFEGKPAVQQRGVPREWFQQCVLPDGAEEPDLDNLRRLTARYWGLTHLVDVNVGRVLEALEERGLRESTIVVFTSDHGDMMGNHGLLSKGTFMYDDITRVPCILSWPGSVPGGKRVGSLTSSIDVIPTLLELMGIPQSPTMQGVSMRQLWDYAFNTREAVFMEKFEAYSRPMPIFAVRTDRWKYSWYLGDIDELYDMDADPQETRNLAREENHDEIVQGLRARIHRWLIDTGDLSFSELAAIPKRSFPRTFS